MKNKILFIGLILVVVAFVGAGCSLVPEVEIAEEEPAVEPLGGTTSDSFTASDLISTDDLTVADDATISGKVTVAGNIANSPDSITATTTLTADSGNLQLLATSANYQTITLPTAADGLRFEFVVVGALTGDAIIIDSAEGDNIEGSLIVNSAIVACSGEDQINIVTDGENIGDRFEIVSDGTSWYIVDSEIETAAKFTCTDPS